MTDFRIPPHERDEWDSLSVETLTGVDAGVASASKAVILGTQKELDEFHTAALYVGAGAGTLVTSSAAELNKLTGVTATAAQLNFVAGVTAGTSAASKAVVLDANSKINALDITTLTLNGTAVTATAAQLNRAAVTTAGTAEASKVAVLGANKNLDEFHTAALYLGAAAGTQVTATATEINVLASVTAGTAAANKAAVLGANKNLDEFHTAALYLGAAAGTQVTATAAEINVLASVSAGVASASKAVVLGASKNLDILSLPVSGLKIGAAGAEVAVDATAAQLNYVAGVTAGTSAASKAVVLDAQSKINALDITTLSLNGTALTTTAAELNKLAGANVVLNKRVRATIAEVNAGKTLVAVAAGKVARLTSIPDVVAIGGAVGGLTTIDVKIGATIKAQYAQAQLIENAVLGHGDSGVTPATAGVCFTAGADGEDITAIKAGGDGTTATHVDFIVNYVLEDA